MAKKRLIVFTGAGISAESGIKTFRDSGGLWEEFRIEDVATIDAWVKMAGLTVDEISGNTNADYKRAVGPYAWQQEGGSKLLNQAFKTVGVTGSTASPLMAVKNASGIQVRGN